MENKERQVEVEFKVNSLTVLAHRRRPLGDRGELRGERPAQSIRLLPALPTWQPPEREQVSFDKNDDKIIASTARYECVSCERPLSQAQRLVALRLIE